ncbi:hypothetical protein B0T26DRAFT_736769 [Lasiosphaeria miniovina]|uniref:PinX1-related protein 1 n=1 Tax=Lasiosphaeria miniovina TaxID=1954250 RepID=A0AA40BGU1_9PEZI|nr:uncharacterized protein B0T26DRAFT_736769 [Lasiosphaeria miniovina]KAK0733975.1 hypothetical protein B0T26DRAFT_736769 [Lasiosphaeria miniovina]
MGLAAAKNKRKLGLDPNNTKWSRNTESFGQKLLRAHGWEPGQYLGAKDAAHAEWHTEANSGHIRVVLKDDNLGLGAKQNNGDQCTGLDAFQHLLGRLNGKAEDVLESEQKARDDMKLSLYLQKKIGTIRFVRGGFLVGNEHKDVLEDAKDLPKDAPDASIKSDEEILTEPPVEESSEESEPSKKKSKKRKAEPGSDSENAVAEKKASNKEKKLKRQKTETEADTDSQTPQVKIKEKRSKRSKTDVDVDDAPSTASRKQQKDAVSASSVLLGDSDLSTSESKKRQEKKQRKKDKKDRKEKRAKRRLEKAVSRSASEAGDSISRERKRRKADKAGDSPAPTPLDSGVSTPAESGSSTAVSTSVRYLSRQRFIAQKRMAFADPAALKEIFMIKS